MCCIVSQGDRVTMIAQTKEGLYQDQYLVDLFFPLIIEIECLHQQVDDFFHCYANMALVAKSFKRPFLLVLHAFYK
jgi:hypothetical protein